MSLRGLHRGLIAGALLLQAAGWCQAAAPAAEQLRWSVNSWGATPPVVRSNEGEACRDGTERASGLRFNLVERRTGNAELVLSSVPLQPGRPYVLTVRLKSLDGKADVDVFFRRTDFPYEASIVRTVALDAGWTTVTLKGFYVSDTPGAARIGLRQSKADICVGATTLQAAEPDQIGPPPAASPVKPRFFGVHINKLGSHQSWPSFNPGAVRLWDTGTTWSVLERESADIDWKSNAYAKRLDFYVQYVRRNSPDAEIIMTLGMTPEWAGTVDAKRCRNSGYGPASCTPPKNLADWRRHVRELAKRYKGEIHVWEIWNEADIWFHWDAGADKLYELVKAASEELKAVDPSNVVIGPNVTGLGARFLNDFLEAGGGRVVDGLSVHQYFGRRPEIAMKAVRNLREMMAAHRVNLSVWNTEMGVSCLTQTECKLVQSGGAILGPDAAIARGLLGQAAMGVENTNYYTWEGAGRKFGGPALVEDDYRTPTRQGELYTLLRGWLVGAKVQPLPSGNEDVLLLSITRAGKTAYAAWSTAGAAKLPRGLVPGVGRSQDLGGKVTPLPKGDVALGEEPVLLLGGGDDGP